ncbi:hypothetical protein BMF94_0705 [Rhodotorula taiwanensis]|uniref:BZIP domain-containing protein n=1 Tax=Rhodotorula taiwanensis TaxID=741276 RepID=A0A2S5BID3_9BASI|nr:hypothetical protein BMF94_0705 [Rhodotorula taiwanensis]
MPAKIKTAAAAAQPPPTSTTKSTKYARPTKTVVAAAPLQPRKPTKTMIQYTSTDYEMQPAAAKHCFDESAADMSAYLDFTSYATPVLSADNDSFVVIPSTEQHHHQPASFANAFDGQAALRPVDDSLLDSPLDLELSPASTFATDSSFSSPFLVDFEGDFAGLSSSTSSSPLTSPLLATDLTSSPSLESVTYPSLFPSPAMTTSTTSLLPGGDIDMAALASSLGVPLPPVGPVPPMSAPLWSPSAVVAPLPFIQEEDEELLDVKPVVAVAAAAAPPVVTAAASAAAPTPKKRKTSAELKAEVESLVTEVPASTTAAASMTSAEEEEEEEQRKRDKFTGIRNTKKPPVAYDAPTLPKNYYTESATSKKRCGSTKVAASVSRAAKRARSASSSSSSGSSTPTPPEVAVVEVELPSAQPEPMPEDEFDESQLSAIELKRRQNTLAARRSRARKSAYIQELKDEIDALKQLNEQLRAQVDAGHGGARCTSCGGAGGAA